jgi:hypothetical protein
MRGWLCGRSPDGVRKQKTPLKGGVSFGAVVGAPDVAN